MICRKCGTEENKINRNGMCSKCNSEIRQKQIALNIMAGECSICKKYVSKRDAFKRGYECGCHDNFYSKLHKSLRENGNCTVCGSYTENRDQQGRCKKCHNEWYLNHNSSEKMKNASSKYGKQNLINFIKSEKFRDHLEKLFKSTEEWRRSEKFYEMLKQNRIKQLDNFYNNMNNFIKDQNITLDGDLINYQDFNFLDGVPGVWALWRTSKKDNLEYCLTVGETINLKKELNWTLRVLANKNLSKLEKEDPGCTGRWDKIQSLYENYKYILIKRDENDKNAREFIESSYAIKNESLYWLPSYTQVNKFK